jgi:hypothetical protein
MHVESPELQSRYKVVFSGRGRALSHRKPRTAGRQDGLLLGSLCSDSTRALGPCCAPLPVNRSRTGKRASGKEPATAEKEGIHTSFPAGYAWPDDQLQTPSLTNCNHGKNGAAHCRFCMKKPPQAADPPARLSPSPKPCSPPEIGISGILRLPQPAAPQPESRCCRTDETLAVTSEIPGS